jgi:hypothetical protein
VERRYKAANIAAAMGTNENDSLLVVDPDMGRMVPELTIQVVNHNVGKIEALEARMNAMETLEARVNARLQAIEHGKS